MTKKKKVQRTDPASMALEAANQALSAANAAVQAAVKALALTRRENDREDTARRKGSIRNAASQARHRLAEDDEGSGVAPLATPSPRAAAKPRAATKPKAAPKAKATPKPRQAAKPRPAPRPPETPAATPAEAQPAASSSSFAARKGRSAAAAPPPTEAPAPPQEHRRQDDQATTRPTGAGPIILGSGTAHAAPPQDQAVISPPPATEDPPAPVVAPPPVAPGPTEAELREQARREAELRQREEEMAAREAAMARYAPLEPAHPVAAKPQAEPNGYTVLVVDDEEQVRALTVRILSRFGYRVLEASGVELALSMLDTASSNVDLVLSDVAMPGLSGKDLFRAIRDSRPGLPVVFMSGYALGVYAPEGLVEEGVKMLPKPFRQEDLLDFVTEALEGAATR